MTRFFEIAADDRPAWHRALVALEGTIDYPLGERRMRLDHGDDYFAFFNALGAVRVFVAERDGRVIGSLIVVRRPMPWDCIYMCDLKVHPQHRGPVVAAGLARLVARDAQIAPPGYAISMNPNASTRNPVAEWIVRRGRSHISMADKLLIYGVDADVMRTLTPALTLLRGPLAYRSLAGIKDLVLSDPDGQVLPVRHVQFGPCALPGESEPDDDAVHMFCAPAGDPLAVHMHDAGLVPLGDATVLQAGMPKADWTRVLTSEI